jgi:hypothetical protein
MKKPLREPPPELVVKMKADAGKGVSIDPLERAYSLYPDDDLELRRPDLELEEWVRAFIDVDECGDLTRLIKKLGAVVPPQVMPHLADLLKRRLSPKAEGGKPPTPSYDRPLGEAKLDLAVRALKRAIKGVGWTTAVNNVALGHGIEQAMLRAAHRGTGPRWYKDAKVKRGEWKTRPARGP